MVTAVRWCGLLVAPFTLAAAVAQIPAHAVRLNPTAGFGEVRLARSGPELHAVGITAGPNPYFIHVARSTDGGRTWPLREVPIAYAQSLADIAADGPEVHVVVSAMYAGPFVISSYDRGTTWAPGVRVSQTSNTFAVSPPKLHKAGSVLNVVWMENRPNGSLWANRSTDGGRTWQPQDQNLTSNMVAGTDGEPVVVALGPELHVFWARIAPTVGTMYQRSVDGGATWLPTAQVLAPTALLRAVGDLNHLVVTDLSGSNMLRSADRGLSWTPVTGHGLTQVADLAMCGSQVLLVGRRGSTFPIDVQLQVSNDAGATWLGAPYIVQQWRNAAVTARATPDASFVHFGFANDFFPVPGVVIQSDDFGASWRLVAGDAGRGVWPSSDGAIVLARTGVSGTDAWAWVLEGHTAHGRGSLGTGGLEPWLVGGGLAGIGRTFRLTVGNARGASVGGLFASFEPLGDAAFGAARLYVQSPIVTVPIATNGTAGAPGGGGADVYVAVPPDPALAGFTLRSQAFVLDPAVADGFAATGAVESWIR